MTNPHLLWFLLGPVWEGGQKDEDNSLHSAMYNSLSECHSRLLSSVAVPAISSGIFGFPKARCAKVLFSAALDFFRAEPKSSVEVIRLTNFDKATVEVFKAAAADLNDEPDVRVQFGQISWLLFHTFYATLATFPSERLLCPIRGLDSVDMFQISRLFRFYENEEIRAVCRCGLLSKHFCISVPL